MEWRFKSYEIQPKSDKENEEIWFSVERNSIFFYSQKHLPQNNWVESESVLFDKRLRHRWASDNGKTDIQLIEYSIIHNKGLIRCDSYFCSFCRQATDLVDPKRAHARFGDDFLHLSAFCRLCICVRLYLLSRWTLDLLFFFSTRCLLYSERLYFALLLLFNLYLDSLLDSNTESVFSFQIDSIYL